MKRLTTLLAAAAVLPSLMSLLLLSSCTVGRMDALFLATAVPLIQVLDPDTGEPLDNGFSSCPFPDTELYQTIQKTFIVTNRGGIPLLIKKLYLLQDEHVDFSLDSMLTDTTILPGEQTEFFVSFKPNQEGGISVRLAIENNTPGDRVFIINLTGHGTSGLDPPTVAIPQVEHGGTYDFGLIAMGYTSTHTFTIHNTAEPGSADLSIITVYPSGEGSTAFNITPPGASSLAPDDSDDFTVTFSPQEALSYTATILVRTDDPDLPLYGFQVTGKGQDPVPLSHAEINVKRGSLAIPSDSIGYDFTSVSIGSTREVTFTVENKGESSLSIDSSSVEGDTVFTTYPLDLTRIIGARGTFDFQVQFTPLENSNYSATVKIGNNDPDEDPYTLQVLGKGVSGSVPDISVWSGGRDIPAGMVYDFGLCPIGKSTSALFTVRNLGTADLKVSVPLIVAGKEFSQSMSSPATVRPGGEHRLTVTFEPVEAGAGTAKMLIRSNDADDNPYMINLAGQGAP